MRERVVRSGMNALVGVLTEPDPQLKHPDAPAVVLLNSGLLHRVGACRLHVRVARDIASAGFTSLRFDYSGVGDSDPRKDGLPFEQAAVAESREAMDYLEKARGMRSFVLIGLCSGADMAFETARADTRVEAIGQLDAYVYKTWRAHLHRWAPRLVNATSWKNLLTGKTYVGPYLRRMFGRSGAAAPAESGLHLDISPYAREFPPKAQVEAGLQELLSRGLRLFNFFSSDYYLYKGQYVDCFRDVAFGDKLRLEFISGADHLVSRLEDQRYLVRAIGDWVRSLRPPLTPKPQPVSPTSAALADQSRSPVASS